MSAIKKAKGFKKSRPGTYLSIAGSLFGAVLSLIHISEPTRP